MYYKFVFASIDTPVDEIERFFKKHEVPYTLKNNGVFVMESSTVIVRKNELLATKNTLISLEENDIYLSRHLNSPTGLRIKNIICGWLNVN